MSNHTFFQSKASQAASENTKLNELLQEIEENHNIKSAHDRTHHRHNRGKNHKEDIARVKIDSELSESSSDYQRLADIAARCGAVLADDQNAPAA